MTEVLFTGMDAWHPASEIILCSGTKLGEVDLHNSCDVVSITIATSKATLAVALAFKIVGNANTGAEFQLRFEKAYNVSIETSLPLPDGEHDVFHAIDYVDKGRFTVEAGSLTINLESLNVAFVCQ